MARRHGEELEQALLDAAWDELVEVGYAAFTMDGVAARAGTSRPVLYRRWSGKHELVRAAVGHGLHRDPLEIPDTGSLRGDTIALMMTANETRLQLTAVVTVGLSGYYEETGSAPLDLTELLKEGRPRVSLAILDRAIERGEVDPARVTPRIAMLPYALMRHDFLMSLKPMTREAVEEIVDTIFLPLVSPHEAG